MWCEIRARIDWSSAVPDTPRPPAPPPAVDGLAAWCTSTARPEDPTRPDRLLTALAHSRADAAHGHPLTFDLLAAWQQHVLGAPHPPPFRSGDAFAKHGRELYACTPRTRDDFARCLSQSTDPSVPPAARAARAYLDVAFFHPFADGNARLAMLALGYVLELHGVRLAEVGPLQTTRYADDAEGAVDLAVLISVLMKQARPTAPALRNPPPRNSSRSPGTASGIP